MISEDDIDLVGAIMVDIDRYNDLKGWYTAEGDFAIEEDVSAPTELMRVKINLENRRNGQFKTIRIDLRNVLESEGRMLPSGVSREHTRALQEEGILP